MTRAAAAGALQRFAVNLDRQPTPSVLSLSKGCTSCLKRGGIRKEKDSPLRQAQDRLQPSSGRTGFGAGLALAALALLAACQQHDSDAGRPAAARGFPRADRPAGIASGDNLATEAGRDRLNEATTVMKLADIQDGMTVADIGAGEGYYTVRLSPRVGRKGRVLAEDIDGAALTLLGDRVQRERLDNVSIKQGDDADPNLPAASFDRIFMIHMVHEVSEPYAFLWHMRPALRPHGRVIVVDVDRPTTMHGIPPRQLFCEFAAVGFRLTEFVRKPELTGYYAQFEAVGERPNPPDIKPCHSHAGP